MKWLRYEEGFKPLHATMGISLVFFVMAFIYLQFSLAASFAAIFTIGNLQNMYYKRVGQGLVLHQSKKRSRFLIGSTSTLVLSFENGPVPLLNGKLTLSIEDAVQPVGEETNHFSGIFDITVPFTVGRFEQIEVTIPLEGRKRGLSRITRVIVEVPQILGHGSIIMELEDAIHHESIVYPKIDPFHEHLLPSPFKPGDVAQRTSLYYDAFQAIGTRDYIITDRFDEIHWKASARMQKLQTKEYLPVAEQSILFIVNMIEKPKVQDDFELKIERLAAYITYCTKNAIPFEIIMNIKTFGGEPFLREMIGSGNIHYQKSLEMLAQLSSRLAKHAFEKVLQAVESKGQLSPTIVLITHEPERYAGITARWAKSCNLLVDHAYQKEEVS